MQHCAPIDAILGPLAGRLRRQADALLDLRKAALGRTDPGACVACYYRLRGGLADAVLAELCPLRRWLENQIEVVAAESDGGSIEALPLRLEVASDLESFCRAIMEEVREDRAYPAAHIALSFRYRDPAVAAA